MKDSPKQDSFKVKADHEWYGQDLAVKSQPLIDPGVGEKVVIREFTFKKDPKFKGQILPTNQQIFNSHWPQIKYLLRTDGLIANTDVPPRIVFNRNGTYVIFVTCTYSFKTFITEKPTILHKLLNKNAGR